MIRETTSGTDVRLDLSDVNWADEQTSDLDIGPVYRAIMHSPNEPPHSEVVTYSTASKDLLAQWQSLTTVNNILHRK